MPPTRVETLLGPLHLLACVVVKPFWARADCKRCLLLGGWWPELLSHHFELGVTVGPHRATTGSPFTWILSCLNMRLSGATGQCRLGLVVFLAQKGCVVSAWFELGALSPELYCIGGFFAAWHMAYLMDRWLRCRVARGWMHRRLYQTMCSAQSQWAQACCSICCRVPKNR